MLNDRRCTVYTLLILGMKDKKNGYGGVLFNITFFYAATGYIVTVLHSLCHGNSLLLLNVMICCLFENLRTEIAVHNSPVSLFFSFVVEMIDLLGWDR